MRTRITRILMNSIGEPGASAAAPIEQPAPTEAPAQPAPVVLDAETRKALLDEARNSIYAEMRRNEQGKKPKTAPEAPAPVANLRALDRAIGRLGRPVAENLYARLERDYAAEAPGDAEAWVKDYFEGFGAPPTTTNTQPRNAIPASNGGSPPAPTSPLEERKLIGMSEEDVNQLARTKGNAWIRKRLTDELRHTVVNLKRK